MKRKRKGAVMAGMWTLCVLTIAVVFATGVLNRQKVWTDVQLTDADDAQREWRIADGDAYGRVGSGPYYDLPVGTYRIKWQIEGDGENRMELSCSNDAQITPAEIAIRPDQWEGEAWFEIREHTHSFAINLDFVSGTYMRLDNIRLYTPFYTDSAFTFAAVLLALCLLACGRRLLGSREAALCASILYIFAIYRLEDLYIRLMVGEMLAMAFLPVFLLGLYEVVLGDQRRWPVLVLGATLVFSSHLLSTVLCACAAAGMAVLFIGRMLREKRIAAMAAAAGVTLLINLNQIVPLLMCFSARINTPVCQFGFADAALELKTMLAPNRYIGMALIIGAAAFVAADVREEEKSARRVLWLVLAAGTACAVLATRLIPWHYISKLTGGLADTLQFPWRFLLLTAVCFALAGGDGIARLLEGRGMRASVCALALCMICALPYIGGMQPYDDELEFGQSAKTYMIYPEYQIAGTDVNATRSRKPLLSGDVTLTAYEKDGTRVTAQVAAESDAQIALPMFGFIGYAAELNGERVDWVLGENNRLTVPLPAGAQGELRVWYEGKAIWKVMDGLSAASVLGLAAFVLIRRRKRA